MTSRRILAALITAALLGAAPRPIVFSAPAGDRPTGAPAGSRPFDAVLPNGRTVAPVGVSAWLEGPDPSFASSIALSPDGRFAVVPGTPHLAVVDLKTMRTTALTDADAPAFTGGVAVATDPRDRSRAIALAGSQDGLAVIDIGADGTPSLEGRPAVMPGTYPTAVALGADGGVAYVATAAGTVATFDLGARRFVGSEPAGFAPAALGVSGGRLYVTNEGVMEVLRGSQSATVPQFSVPPFDSVRGSSLMRFVLSADGTPDAAGAQSVKMDPAPDALQNVGGAHPTAIAFSKDGRFAFVCMTGVDRIAVVALSGVPRVIGGLSLRLFESSAIGSAPYGTAPVAIAASRDGKRLYVALAGIDAVAVVDATKPATLRRLGLIPTGWYPAALALSPDDRHLYVVNAKGTVARGGAPSATVQRIDLSGLPLTAVTLSALRYDRSVAYAKKGGVVPTMRIDRPVRSPRIAHVVTILDDDPLPDALAAKYASAGDYSPDGASPRETQRYLDSGTATPFAVLRRSWGDDPDAYARAGSIFNGLQRAGRSYRDYGELLLPTGYDEGLYTSNIPALSALASHVDLAYAGWNERVTDGARAAEFVRDLGRLNADDAMPDFVYAWLPHGDQADTDGALMAMIDAIAQGPAWSSTAIFVVGDDPDRPGLVLVSPWARPGYVSRRHLSTASVVKTEEELLGLPPLALDDLLASDAADMFGTSAVVSEVVRAGRVEPVATDHE